jgi:3-hydroxyanthranilate 3,4-dioxygenase
VSGAYRMELLQSFNLKRWIDENRHLLKPPIGNKRIFRDGDFVIMAVGGPNSRNDYHVDPGQEFFYQLEGDLLLKTMQGGTSTNTWVRSGELLLLPPYVPHSPQRFANTIGLVIERPRRPGELDGCQWYCENCNHLLYEEFFQLKDIETQFGALFERFYSSLERRTCKQCGSVIERKS